MTRTHAIKEYGYLMLFADQQGSKKIEYPACVSPLRRWADRAALDEIRFDRRLAGVFFSLADVIDPAHDAVRHRAVAPADMRDRWLALAKMWVVVDADQGKIPRYLNVLVE